MPTGNFGDVLAGWAAKRMGLPIERLNVATNANDILARARDRRYETTGVVPTTSPSMDIQVSLELRAAALRGSWAGRRGDARR